MQTSASTMHAVCMQTRDGQSERSLRWAKIEHAALVTSASVICHQWPGSVALAEQISNPARALQQDQASPGAWFTSHDEAARVAAVRLWGVKQRIGVLRDELGIGPCVYPLDQG